MDRSNTLCVSFRDLTDKKDISIKEPGLFNIGLLSDGTVEVSKKVDALCVTLLTVTVTETGGTLLAPANADLLCRVNSNDILTGEINLIDGTRLEVASKKLVFINGPIPKMRRKLPPTPGKPLAVAPPSKPARSSASKDTSVKQGDVNIAAEKEKEDDPDKRWLETSWCMLDLRDQEKSLVQDFDTAEQIAILSASYFTKQLRLYTDAAINSELLDSIFKMFTDTVIHCRTTYLNYLSTISRLLSKNERAHTHTPPMHGPAVKLLTELLQQCFDPISRVILILDLLRTFSHFDSNLVTMVACKTAAAVMGSMSAYLDVVEVQQLALDILAKMALYKPVANINKKSPVREAAVDMTARAANHHNKDIGISRASCRVLSNLSSTLMTVLNSWMERDPDRIPSEAVMTAIESYLTLLVYVFKEGVPIVQQVLTSFHDDLGVNTEGRKFIYFYAKLSQIQHKKDLLQKHIEASNREESESSTELDASWTKIDKHSPPALKAETVEEAEQPGILKKSRSYENLRTKQKRLYFAGDTAGGSASDSDISSSSSSNSDVSRSDSDTSDDEDDIPEFESKICREISMDDDFSFHVVKSLVKKTIRRRKTRRDGKAEIPPKTCENELDTDDEFLDSYSASRTSKAVTYKPEIVANSSVHVYRSNKVAGGSVEDNSSVQADGCDDVKVVDDSLEDNADGNVQLNDSATPNDAPAREGHISSEAGFEIESKGSEAVKAVNVGLSITGQPLTCEVKATDNAAQEGAETNLPIKAPVPAPRKKPVTNTYHDVPFMGKLVRTQIICHIGVLVFKGEDSEALMVIDRSIKTLLQDSHAPVCLVTFAEKMYGVTMTLMDLEPAIVISVIDAVRYRSLTQDLVQSAVLSLTRSIAESLHQSSVDCLMLFYKQLFAETSLKTSLTDKDFLEEFRTCFQNAITRLGRSHNIEEIHSHLKSTLNNFAV